MLKEKPWMPSLRENDRPRPQAGRTARRPGARVLLAAALLAAGLSQAYGQADPFAERCEAQLSNIQPDRRLCVVGIAQDDWHLLVIAATKPDLIGRVVAVYEIDIKTAMAPPPIFAGYKGRILAVGGIGNGSQLHRAQRL
jgi:hypothetical protein